MLHHSELWLNFLQEKKDAVLRTFQPVRKSHRSHNVTLRFCSVTGNPRKGAQISHCTLTLSLCRPQEGLDINIIF